ncbi:hypothetical protein AMATHDRAFT_8288 [Amanita thiersii Skay4041]|uniref:Uncharacterized protein n=1 Tax=Amanita thiersii Skay4041 TaxID=703135 RepID=A0A2A9NEA2_9AGAR|nr:hypothetical protein AMATHDRAFT_8288 [Amanita thiersii Skay4041]
MDTATCSILTPKYDPPKSYHSSFVRDYVLDNDGEGMRKAMEQIASEEEAIRLHNETLKAMEDAALARAMELSKETALREAMHRACRPEIHTSPCPSRNQDGHQTVKQDQISYLATASSVTLVSTDSSTERSNQMSKAIEWSQMSNSGGKPNEPYGDYSFTGSSSLRISAFPRTSGSNQATEQLGNKSNHAMSSWRTGVSSCSDSSVSSSSKSSERDSSHADSICKLREDSFDFSSLRRSVRDAMDLLKGSEDRGTFLDCMQSVHVELAIVVDVSPK